MLLPLGYRSAGETDAAKTLWQPALPKSSTIDNYFFGIIVPSMNALDKAVKAIGNRSRLAKAIGISREAVRNWTKVPAERVLKVEAATGISRHDLRPDIYPKGK